MFKVEEKIRNIAKELSEEMREKFKNDIKEDSDWTFSEVTKKNEGKRMTSFIFGAWYEDKILWEKEKANNKKYVYFKVNLFLEDGTYQLSIDKDGAHIDYPSLKNTESMIVNRLKESDIDVVIKFKHSMESTGEKAKKLIYHLYQLRKINKNKITRFNYTFKIDFDHNIHVYTGDLFKKKLRTEEEVNDFIKFIKDETNKMSEEIKRIERLLNEKLLKNNGKVIVENGNKIYVTDGKGANRFYSFSYEKRINRKKEVFFININNKRLTDASFDSLVAKTDEYIDSFVHKERLKIITK